MTDMDTMQRMIGEWADATFPKQTDRSVFQHLREEVAELDMDLRRGGPELIGEELADCAILLMNLAHLVGVSLADEIGAKHATNAGRTWKLDDTGMVHHGRRRGRA